MEKQPIIRRGCRGVRRLRNEGWDERWGKGDHLVPSRGNQTVIVPVARKALPLGTAHSVAKQAGWLVAA